MSSEIFVGESHAMIKSELHTKYASPQRLARELKTLLGGSEFEVEMRHNVYNILSSKPFNVETLLNKCQARHRMKSAREERQADSLF